MAKFFKDPIAPKVGEKKVKDPWDFDAPDYDQRTGGSIGAGTNYGTGFRNPVGKARGSAKRDMPDKAKKLAPKSLA